MPLENATYITDLVTSNPAHSDGLSDADAHLRLIKGTLKATFPNFTDAALQSTQAQLDATVAAVAPAGVLMPTGAILDFGMANPPSGWLACDGQAVSRTDFANLFEEIGTTWGAGDGSTTFNVPNLVSRYRRHRDNSTLSGAVGTLQNPANLAHTHVVSASSTTATENALHTHSFSGTTGAMNGNQDHSHTYDPHQGGEELTNGIFPGGASSGQNASTSAVNIDHSHNFSGSTSTESAAHAHGFSFTVTSGGGSADNASETRPFSATVLTCIKT